MIGGSLVAQAIPVLLSPVLARLYLPHDFGILAYFAAAISILSVVVTGKLENAVFLPRSHTEALTLTIGLSWLCVLVSTIVLALSASYAWVVPGAFWSQPEIAFLLPLSLLSVGIVQTVLSWLNRQGIFVAMVAARIVQAASTGAVQLLLGLVAAGTLGLIIGATIGYVLGCVIALCAMARAVAPWRSAPRPLTALTAVKKHWSMVAYLVPGQFANVVAVLLPVIILGSFFGPAVAGLYALAERVLLAPMALVGTAIGEVYRERASRDLRVKQSCRSVFLRSAVALAAVAAVPAGMVAVLGPQLFAWVFGDGWRGSGEIAQVLSVTMFCQLVSVPLSHTVLLSGRYKWDFYWQLLRLVLAAATLVTVGTMTDDHIDVVRCYAIVLAIMYLAHTALQFVASGGAIDDRRQPGEKR